MPDTATAKQQLIESVYKTAYLKAERSGIHLDDASKSKTIPALEKLKAAAGIDLPNTLLDMHKFLVSEGANISYLDLLKAVKDDFFKHNHKSMFLSLVANEWPGEMNMFVVRRIAVKKKKADEVIERISQQYDGNVLIVKPIPPLARFFKSRHMRGNKWRRGGRPHYAMVVFDANPQPASAEDRNRHFFVLNRRQFFKPELREWFAETTKTPIKQNPLHSTDNEAEALAHLHLFFTPQEQKDILAKVEALRTQIATKTKKVANS